MTLYTFRPLKVAHPDSRAAQPEALVYKVWMCY